MGTQFLDETKFNYINEFRPQCKSFPGTIRPRRLTGIDGREVAAASAAADPPRQ